MNPQRRVILKRSIQAGAAFVLLAGPQRLWAKWPAAAFDASSLNEVLAELGADPEDAAAEESERILVDVPAEVENSAIVAVRVSTDLPDVESISILVEDNQVPLAASFTLSPEVTPMVSTRIRLEQSGRIVALVKTSNGYFLNGGSVEVKPFRCDPVKVPTPAKNTSKSSVPQKKAEANTN